MTLFRLLLAAIAMTLAAYTMVVISHHGLDILPIFFGDIAAMAWPGQFNLDFLFMLILAGLWAAWRHDFKPVGLLLWVVAISAGALFVTIYLLITTLRTRGDMAAVLLGQRRADALRSGTSAPAR